MVALALKRFPDTITRRRQGPGSYNPFGEYEPGASVDTDLKASVQSLNLTDSDIAGGVSLVERLRIYVRESDALLAAFDDRQADKVLWRGESYVVEETRAWPGRHTRATILRET